MIEEGRLQITGGLLMVEQAKDNFMMEINNIKEEVDAVIKAIGFTYDLRNNDTLFQNMNEQKVLKFTRFGSLDINPSTL